MEKDAQKNKGFFNRVGALFHWALLAGPTVFCFLLVCWYFMIFSLQMAPFVLIALLIVLSIVVRMLPQSIRPQIRQIRSGLISAIALVGLYALFHPAFVTAPLFISLAGIVAAIFCFAKIPSRRKTLLAALYFLCCLFTLLGGVTWQVAALAIFYSLSFLLIGLVSKKPSFARTRNFIALLFIATACWLFTFYKAPPPDQSDLILSQPGVSAIFLHSQSESPLAKALGDECRLVEENCDGGLLLGTRRQETGLVWYQEGRIKTTPVRNISDYIAIDCDNHLVYAADMKLPAIHVFDSTTMNMKKMYGTAGLPGVSRLRFDKDTNALLLSRDDTARIAILDLATGEARQTRLDKFVLDFNYSKELDALFVSSWGGLLRRYSFAKMELQESSFTPDWLIQFEIDDKNLLIYLTRFYSGQLLKMNLSTLEIIDKVKLEPGIRFPILDTARGCIFVANFFTGTAKMLDAKTLEVLDQRYFGKRLRSISLSRDGKRLYAPSSQGVFIWNLESD